MCNGCHDISTKAISMHNLCIGYNNFNAYRVNFVFMSKNYAIILIKNAVIKNVICVVIDTLLIKIVIITKIYV